jgi:mono/diheme cytochrome c family protein
MNQPQNFDNTDLDRLHAAVKREKPDVVPGREPAPLWMTVGMMLMMVLGGGYAGAYVGGFDSETSNAFGCKPTDPRGIANGGPAQLGPFDAAMKKGSQVYAACQGCHQATGVGVPGAIPPLAGSEWVQGGTERICRIVLHGLSGIATVKGANYNGVMPPQGAMTDAELAAVLTYVRNSWGNKGSMVTKEMMAKVREKVAAHVGPWNPAELQEFSDKNVEGPIPDGPGATVAPEAKK